MGSSINNKKLKQPFLIDSCKSNDFLKKTVIPKDSYFVMIDMRKMIETDSLTDVISFPYDSRKINTVYVSNIVGVTNLK
jgi:hypothetical protein